MSKKIIVQIMISAFAVIFLFSCSAAPEATSTQTISTTTPSVQVLKTTLGDFVIVSTRPVDEVRDSKAPEGYQFLLIGLERPGSQKLIPGEFLLEDFQKMVNENHDEIYISGKEGAQSFYSQMGGWLDDDFVVGFTVPVGETYTLYWPGNTPIPLKLEE
jgi:hypothetical protein